jgi:hypothetical protein
MRKSQKIGNTLQSLLSSSKTGKCTDGSSKPYVLFAKRSKSIAEKGYNAYILAHSDVDGLVSASIVLLTLMRLGVPSVRFEDFLSCIKRVIIEFNSKNYA